MTTSPYLLHLTRSSLRKKLLVYFFSNPDARLYLRELAVVLNVDPANLSRDLRKFEQEGVFNSSKRGNQKFFSLNRKYSLYDELKSMIYKTMGVRGALESLVRAYPDIQKAFIYGSFAKNSEKAGSDIDVCLVLRDARFQEEPFVEAVHRLEKQLGREISYVRYTAEEWREKQNKNDSFVCGLLKGKRIELKNEKD